MKIVLLLDGTTTSAWVKDIVASITASSNLRLVLIVENSTPVSVKPFSLYRLFRKADRALFKAKPDAFLRTTLPAGDVPVVKARTSKVAGKNILEPAVINQIKSHQPDVILRFGFGIISGDIFNIATHGVWSLHHGDNDHFRGGPPGFWEWYYKKPFTGVTLQRISDELDGGEVIDKITLPTDFTSLIRNQNKIFWAGADLMVNALGRYAAGRKRNIPPGNFFYSERLYRDPRASKAASAFWKLMARAVSRAFLQMFTTDQWTLFVSTTTGKQAPSPTLRRYRKITPPKGRFWADPFVVSKEGSHFIFMEEFVHEKNKGHIACLQLDGKGIPAADPKIVIETDSHLSYPFILNYQDNFYMIPESAANNTVDLYRCVDFPLQWKHEKTLMQGVEAYDSTLHFHEGRWWMFQTRRSGLGGSVNSALYLFYADDFSSTNWKAHPSNPVVTHAGSARPAGRIFSVDGVSYRPAQRCAPRYGYAIALNKIIVLNENEYREEETSCILPNWTDQLLSVHTLNFTPEISIVDGQIRRARI